MKFYDRLWLMLNKRKPLGWSQYITIYGSGFFGAFWLIFGIALIKSPVPWAGGVLLALFVFSTMWNFILDSHKGYPQALGKRDVELWHEKRKKLGVE